MKYIKRFFYALCDGWKTFFPVRNPRIIMTLLVKNEEELLEANLLFHKRMGVDAFIVTDNNSTDSTPAIIRKYVEKGWIVDVIKEPATDYSQKKWVDRMVWLAKTKHHADWIINADADEFWYAPSGSLKSEFAATRANVLRCWMENMYPDETRPFYQWDSAVKEVPNPVEYGLSLYSIFEHRNKKVAHRSDGYMQISMGNHKVKMLPQYTKDSSIRVYHFGLRGRKQFVDKMINGGKQLEQHKGRHGGRHWRYFYSLYKEGRINEEYDRVIGLPVQEKLREDGYIFVDKVISNELTKILK